MSPALKLVLDCADPKTFAEFWAAAFDYKVLGCSDNYTLLAASDGGPQLLLQRVDEPKLGGCSADAPKERRPPRR